MARAAPLLTRRRLLQSALAESFEAFKVPENMAKMAAAKSSAGNDVMQYMQLVMPVAMEIQKEVNTQPAPAVAPVPASAPAPRFRAWYCCSSLPAVAPVSLSRSRT